MRRIFIFILFVIAIKTVAQDKKQTEQLDTLRLVTLGCNPRDPLMALSKTAHQFYIKTLKAQSIQSIEDVLALASGVDIRTRGGKGVQADISIRGGNFDQVLILLNGVPVNNPQTGHLALELPVDFSMLEKILVIEGASGQNFGVNSYSGVINLITKNPEKKQAETRLSVGQFGYVKVDLNMAQTYGKWALFSGLTYQKSNGYLQLDSINNTDFNTINYFANLRYKHDKYPVDLQVGYHQKDFGANSFYTSKYPWQYEKTDGYFANLSTKFGDKIQWNVSAGYRLNNDEFQLFRESQYAYQNGYYIHKQDTAQYAPGFYYKGHNRHKTQMLNARVFGRYSGTYGTSSVTLSAKKDYIDSNVLGKNQRSYLEAGLNHSLRFNDIGNGSLKLGAGINILASDAYKTQANAGAYINYDTGYFTYFISVNSTSRLPTFTDLYYAGPTNIGNPDLQPETAVSYEVGSKFQLGDYKANLSLFHRQSNNTIDWVKAQPADKWQAQNLTRLATTGLSFDAQKYFYNSLLKKVSLSYTYLQMDKGTNGTLISKYALDYLKHSLAVNLSHRFFYKSKIHWTVNYKQREGTYLDYVNNSYQVFDYQPYWLTNVKWTKKIKNTTIGLSVENLFNVDYRDLSYVKMPGRWIIAELHYKIY